MVQEVICDLFHPFHLTLSESVGPDSQELDNAEDGVVLDQRQPLVQIPESMDVQPTVDVCALPNTPLHHLHSIIVPSFSAGEGQRYSGFQSFFSLPK